MSSRVGAHFPRRIFLRRSFFLLYYHRANWKPVHPKTITSQHEGFSAFCIFSTGQLLQKDLHHEKKDQVMFLSEESIGLNNIVVHSDFSDASLG